MEERDLLHLVRQGRVRFYEKNQYVLAQGSSRGQVLVIQQGTVLLWDEQGNEAKLLDVRGAGDLLGIDQMNQVASHPYAVRSASDLLVYAFPSEEFNALVEKYPLARQYVSAYAGGPTTSRSLGRQDPQNSPLAGLQRNLIVCAPEISIREAARTLLQSANDVLLIKDSQDGRPVALTPETFLNWVAQGDTNADKPVSTMVHGSCVALHADATVADGVLAMAKTDCSALAITSDGTSNGAIHGYVTSRDIGQAFGDQPLVVLAELARAQNESALRTLNKRARSLVLRYLSSGAASDWLAGFTSCVDLGILRQIISLKAPALPGCWCLRGSSGRAENLVSVSPELVFIASEGHAESFWRSGFQRVLETLGQCGYLPAAVTDFEPHFYASTIREWKERYNNWVADPILKMFYQARPLFDLRPVCGNESLFEELEGTVAGALNREFLHVIANDCLSTIPPLTFFKNAVVDEVGEEAAVFRLEEDALRPLVDVGRVFGMASRKVFHTSTLDRFGMASVLLPAEAPIFEEAAEALRTLLWQKGRAGIGQETAGAEIPPSLLSPYDRQLLKKAFRAISRLIEFTGDLAWLKRL